MISEGSTNGQASEGEVEQETPANTGKQASGNGSAKAATSTEELQNKLQEAEKKYLYLYSEFENFRRRNERERQDFLKFGHEGFLRDLLQVTDNFERALAHAKSLSSEKGTPLAQVVQGIEMIHHQLSEALKGQGVNQVPSVGQKFDPAVHEAVGEEEADSDPGTVVKEANKGYQLHGRLLRPARVMLAKKI